MTEAQHLSDALQGLFAQPDHGWFTSFATATDGLTAEQAAHVPAPRFNSVWGVVNHVRFWQEAMLLRLRGLEVDRSTLGAEDGWPPAGDSADENGWRSARERALEVNELLAKAVSGLSDQELAEPTAPGRALRYQVIQGIITHNSYHTCEIISIRHMQGLWLERT